MKKNLLIGLSTVIVIILIIVAYNAFKEEKVSPPMTSSITNGELTIKVNYGAPSKRGRIIFGEASTGALQPYGRYWRLGANAATEITFSKNVLFSGKPLNAGTYRMYAVPGQQTWKVILNSELGQWGAQEPDHTLDVLQVDVPSAPSAVTEQFVIKLANDSTGVNMDFLWDNVQVRVPVAPQ